MTDLRELLIERKPYGQQPTPLRRYLAALRLSAKQLEVFWEHFYCAHHNGDWCSRIGVDCLAQWLHCDRGTIIRAHERLEAVGLIRRSRRGRNPRDPMREETALTEICLPSEIEPFLKQVPDRSKAYTPPPATSHPPDLDSSSSKASTPPVAQASPERQDALAPDCISSSEEDQTESVGQSWAQYPSHDQNDGTDQESQEVESTKEALQEAEKTCQQLFHHYAQHLSHQGRVSLHQAWVQRRCDAFSPSPDEALSAETLRSIRQGLRDLEKAGRRYQSCPSSQQAAHTSRPQAPRPVEQSTSTKGNAGLDAQKRKRLRAMLMRMLGRQGQQDAKRLAVLEQEADWALSQGTYQHLPFERGLRIIGALIRDGRWQRPYGLQ